MSVEKPEGTFALGVLSFVLGGDTYGLPIEAVAEVVALEAGAVAAEDGETPPLADAYGALGLAVPGGGAAPVPTGIGIVVRQGDRAVVLAVDDVRDVISLAGRTLSPAPDRFGERTASAVQGIVDIGGSLLILLEPEAVLSAVAREEAADAG